MELNSSRSHHRMGSSVRSSRPASLVNMGGWKLARGKANHDCFETFEREVGYTLL